MNDKERALWRERAERWIEIADSYSRRLGGGEYDPADAVEYPMQVMSLLSDAQEMLPKVCARSDFYGIETANLRINAAKLMLSRMIEAARAKELKDG